MAKILTQAAVEKLKPILGKRRFVRDAGSRSLFLVIQPSGFKSWVMRLRRSGGAAASRHESRSRRGAVLTFLGGGYGANRLLGPPSVGYAHGDNSPLQKHGHWPGKG